MSRTPTQVDIDEDNASPAFKRILHCASSYADTLKLAEECGFTEHQFHGAEDTYFQCTAGQLEQFAAHERERIAKVFDGMGLRPYAEIVRDSAK